MKIASAVLHTYSLKLSRELQLKGKSYSHRRGILLELVTDCGKTAYGDICPLDGFSHESLEQAEQAARSLLPRLRDTKIAVSLDDNLPPSVLFAVETALLQLRAVGQSVDPVTLLGGQPRNSVSVNGLLTGDAFSILTRAGELVSRGYNTLKLKVGQKAVEEDIEIVKQLRDTVGGAVALRLDANRSMTIEAYKQFAPAVAHCDIEYIEEPTDDVRNLLGAFPDLVSHLPIALDETLLEIRPDDLVFFSGGIKAIVVKPTLVGFDRARRLCALAGRFGIPATISSAFCSGVGMLPHVWLAASVNDSDIAAGFDTMSWFDRDLIDPMIPIEQGSIRLDRLPNLSDAVDRSRLTEIARV